MIVADIGSGQFLWQRKSRLSLLIIKLAMPRTDHLLLLVAH